MIKWQKAFLWALVSLVVLFTSSASAALMALVSDPQFRRRINCAKLKDGNYVFGCSRFYSICTNGHEHPMNCVEGLVLNPSNDQCNAPRDVTICKKSGDANLYRSKDPFTCAGRVDGNYEAQICSSFYYQCLGGQQFERPCPQGLAYIPKQNVCDFMDTCKREAASRQTTANLEIVDPNKGNADPNAANANANLNRRSGNNNYRPPGAAVPNGYTAAAPSPVYQQQPAPVKQLASPQEATVQNNSPTPVAQQAPPPAQSHVYWGSGSDQNNANPVPVFDCSGKQDGVYMKDYSACTNTFYKCSNGNGFRYLCPVNLFYNVENNQCNHNQHVVACGGQAPTTTAAPSLDYTATRKPVAFDCAGRPDGYYQTELCSPVFFSCIGGMDSQINCPAGTVFDISSMICNYPSQCGQPRTTPALQMQSQVINQGNIDYYRQRKSQQSQQYQESPQQAPVPVYQRLQQTAQVVQPVYQPPQQYLVSQAGSQVAQQQASLPSYQPLQQAPSIVAQSPSFDCSGKQDGYYYKKPCTASFVICSAGQLSTETCPGNLVFDPSVAYCQYPDVCGQPSATTTTVASPPQQQRNSSQMVYSQQAGSASTAPKSISIFDCSGLPDGYNYKKACTDTFYTCASGHTIELQCPTSLVFDPTTTRCEFQNMCGKTKQLQQPVQVPPVAPTSAPQTYYTVPSAAYTTLTNTTPVPAAAQTYYASTPVSAQQPVTDLNCAGRPDGYYWKHQCTASYYFCNAGQSQAMQCPSGLVFDTVNMQCDYASQCGKPVTTTTTLSPQTTTTVAAPQQSQQQVGYQQQQQTVQKSTQQQTYQQREYQPQQGQHAKNFTCNGRIDGYYIKKSCTTHTLVVLEVGVANKLDCPAGLVFDVSTSNCEYPDQCGKATTTTTAASPVAANPTPSPTPVNYDCSGKADGLYTQAACQNQYVSCVNGQAYQYDCPSQLVFNGQTGSCDYLNNCQSSNSSQASPPTTVPTATQSYPRKPYQAAIPVANNKIAPSAYSQQTISSSTQQSSVQQPTSGNVYDSQSSVSQPQQQAAATVATTQPPVPASEFDCSKRETGYYSKGCSSSYYSCNSGITYALQCPSQLMYNQKAAACDHSANVPECGAKRVAEEPAQQPSTQTNTYAQESTTRTNTYAQQSTTQTNSYTQQNGQQQQVPAIQQVTMPFIANCGKLTTGTHGSAPCSVKYLTCWNGEKSEGTCFDNLVFNPLNGKCDYPINVKGCAQYSAAGPVSSQVSYGINSVITTTSQASTTSNSYSNSAYSTKPQPQGQMEPRAIPPNVCQQNHKTDGYISNGCSENFFHCTEGVTHQLKCPATLFYDLSTGNCDYKESVPACASTVQMLPSQPSTGQPSASVSSSEFDCSKQPSGYFSKGCSSRYYGCHSGTAYLFHCPSGLKYAQQTGACDFNANVPECGWLSKSSEASPAAGSATSPPQVQSQIQQQPTSDYAVPQQPVQQQIQQQPIGGYAVQQQAPQRAKQEVQSQVLQQVQQPEYIPKYAGQQIKEKVFAPPQPQAVQIAQQQQPQPSTRRVGQNTVDYAVAGGDPCASLAPGTYARPCSPHYFQCTHNQKTVELVSGGQCIRCSAW
uniref:Chitin-binding type-2 domain-containing protein n=1 Tax=Ditylenchus dipsaci TaxID=166011 RepID=A0A915EF02_9BILA